MAPDRDAWTAGGLRAGVLALPAVGAELFIQAGAIVAERLSVEPDGAMVVEAALKRAAAQASVLLQLYKLNAAKEGSTTIEAASARIGPSSSSMPSARP